MKGLISVVVTTYNWPSALQLCIESLMDQTDKNFEIIIADDGSKKDTAELIASFHDNRARLSVKHIYHEDQGFRAGTIRNKAVAASKGDYLIFLDGDCVVLAHFIHRHRRLAQAAYFIPGNRILLSQNFTQTVISKQINLQRQSWLDFFRHRLLRHINRLSPLVYFPWDFLRHLSPLRWDKAMTCNLAVWKTDFIAVNGFDHLFEGWGYEDSDLIIRLIHNGIRRKEGRFALPVLHLWHKQNDRSKHDENYQRLLDRLSDTSVIKALKGLDTFIGSNEPR